MNEPIDLRSALAALVAALDIIEVSEKDWLAIRGPLADAHAVLLASGADDELNRSST